MSKRIYFSDWWSPTVPVRTLRTVLIFLCDIALHYLESWWYRWSLEIICSIKSLFSRCQTSQCKKMVTHSHDKFSQIWLRQSLSWEVECLFWHITATFVTLISKSHNWISFNNLTLIHWLSWNPIYTWKKSIFVIFSSPPHLDLIDFLILEDEHAISLYLYGKQGLVLCQLPQCRSMIPVDMHAVLIYNLLMLTQPSATLMRHLTWPNLLNNC